MEYRQLGKTGMQISRIGFGCMSLKPGDSDNENLLHEAVNAGINYFDTADLYNNGANEELVSKALKPYRDKVIIATKVGNKMRPDGSGWDWDPSRKYILDSVEKSLRRLDTDRIDLYQLHGGTIHDPIDETIETFELLKQQGKIRHYGISSIRPNVIREWVNRSSMVSVMMQYSVLDQRPAEECLNLLSLNQIAVLARGVMAQGLLVNKPAKEYLGRSSTEVAEIASLMNAQNIPASVLALQYVLHHKAINAAIVGIRTRQQLRDALAVTELPPIPTDALEKLQRIAPPNHYTDHR